MGLRTVPGPSVRPSLVPIFPGAAWDTPQGDGREGQGPARQAAGDPQGSGKAVRRGQDLTLEQISRSLLAICLAGASHRKTWHFSI